MNKVVTIELAGQVFWVDETGFDLLQHYLVQLKEQLAQHESSDDIFLDIQLRLAELLYQHQPNPNQCIQNDELLKIIDQIGLIEDEQPPKEPATKRSYRDPNNRIIAGVCAGIGARLGVPAFLIRLIFLPTILFFGLGIVLYGLLWLAIRPKDNRSSNLEASGITPTAASIAQYEQPKPSPLLTLQRILFLPFSLVGLILMGTGSHLSKRRSFYFKLGKNVIVDGEIETVNGDITIEENGRVSHNLTTTNGDVVLALNTHIKGDIIFEHSKWSSVFESKNQRTLNIAEGVTVEGNIYLYSPVELVLPDSFDKEKIQTKYQDKK